MKNFILPVLCVALLMTAACKKEQQKETTDRATSATVIVPANPTLSGVLGTGHAVRDTIRLTSNISWRLNGLVFVDSLDVLQVDDCCRILCLRSTASGVPGGGLVICRGGQIIAVGKPDCPIVFTSAETVPQPGDWAGIILIGNASSNDPARVRAQGIPISSPADVTYGGTMGTNDTDFSGVMKCVRIEYAGGFELSNDNNFNGLTLAGVGSSTIIDSVEVFKSGDDGFQFFGGTVNASHLIVCDATDDLFETTGGYSGTIRYALGLADTTRAHQSQSNGIISQNNANGTNAIPLTNPKYKYVTIIGLPNQSKASNISMPPSGIGRYSRAGQMRRNTDFDVDSSIVMGYNFGFCIDSLVGTTTAKYRANHAGWLTNSFAHAYYTGGSPAGISAYIAEANGNPATGAGFALTSPGSVYNYAMANGNRDFTGPNPNAGILLSNPFSRSSAGNFIPVSFSPARQMGAFPNGINWAASQWARFQ